MLRRLLRTEDRSENRLESINGNNILLGTNFQGEKLVQATENSLGVTVELRERLYGGVLANKHVLSRGQSCGNTNLRGSNMMRRRQSYTTKSRLNPVQELSGREIHRVPGRQRGAPYTASAAENPVLLHGVVRRPSMTRGR